MKKLEIIIPHRRLNDASEILKGANTGGMSHYKIEGRGKVKAEPVAIGRGTMQYIIIKDDQVEELINKFIEKLGGDTLGGKIFVTDVQTAVDLSSKQRGESTI
ncbi:MAG TPA: P-II family nitrogen regulator [Nitrososphaeraceae archaeon]|jgi:nitrogen regulatory protein P-II 1